MFIVVAFAVDMHGKHRGYYMASWGYGFYLRVLKVSPTSTRSY